MPRGALLILAGAGLALLTAFVAVRWPFSDAFWFEARPDQLAICGYTLERAEERDSIRVVSAGDRQWAWSDLSITLNPSRVWFGFSPHPQHDAGNESSEGVRSPLGDIRPDEIRLGDNLTFCDGTGASRSLLIEVELVPQGKTAGGTGFAAGAPC